MCNHKNLILEDNGTSTCVDCSIHFEKKLYVDKFVDKFVVQSPQKSSTWTVLEQDYGIVDVSVLKIAEKIFILTTKTKTVKGTNRKSILCASLYYAYYYLKRPTSFKNLLEKFNLTRIHGAKGIRLCQIAMQENTGVFEKMYPMRSQCDNEVSSVVSPPHESSVVSPPHESSVVSPPHESSVVRSLRDLAPVALPVARRATGAQPQRGWVRATGSAFISTHKEKLEELILKYGISIKYYDEIEQVIVRMHSIRGKPLTDNINTLWISAIFFWLSLKNPFIKEEDFLSINTSINTEAKNRISLTKLKTDLSCIKKNLRAELQESGR